MPQMTHAYKRNQVEEAIAMIGGLSGHRPPATLRNKLKRLLDTDRVLDRNDNTKGSERRCHAFFSGQLPGTGVDASFSEYEGFALLCGWYLLEHGWPQTTVVSSLRQVRRKLAAKHAEILQWEPSELFNKQKVVGRLKTAKPFALNTRPIFLAIISRRGRPMPREVDHTRTIDILDEHEVEAKRREPGLSLTTLELVTIAHQFRRALQNTTPRKRGRASV